jgi:hypothetical protein
VPIAEQDREYIVPIRENIRADLDLFAPRALDREPSRVDFWREMFDDDAMDISRQSAVSSRQLAVGSCQLTVGNRPLAVGQRLVTADC